MNFLEKLTGENDFTNQLDADTLEEISQITRIDGDLTVLADGAIFPKLFSINGSLSVFGFNVSFPELTEVTGCVVVGVDTSAPRLVPIKNNVTYWDGESRDIAINKWAIENKQKM